MEGLRAPPPRVEGFGYHTTLTISHPTPVLLPFQRARAPILPRAPGASHSPNLCVLAAMHQPVYSRSTLARLMMDQEHFVDVIASLMGELTHYYSRYGAVHKLIGRWQTPMAANVFMTIMEFVTDTPAEFTWHMYPNIEAADNDPVLPYHDMHFARMDFGTGFQTTQREENLRLHVKAVAMLAQTAALHHDYNLLLRRVAVWRLIERRVRMTFAGQ